MSHVNQHISQLREDFMKGELSEKTLYKSPDLQFEQWMNDAISAKVTEVPACNLATVDSQNKPSSRIVYLREFGDNNFFFYTNYESRKAKDISENPHVCLTFFWPELERQIRIEGIVFAKADKEKSDAYFNARPRDSKIGAWSSPQSRVLQNREVLDTFIDINSNTFHNKEIPRPDFWGGYHIKANYYEFWQGRKNRLHDRICFTLGDNQTWKIERLAP
ncbi:MAG: pyridoxamine 5-phosphate oxidase [Bacteroidota bacterium]|jgi:pyridoxamine 5'-phosphate oxidase|nr:pyridoxamine 5-phosphate oxidase [Bacteroidota bacterium]